MGRIIDLHPMSYGNMIGPSSSLDNQLMRFSGEDAEIQVAPLTYIGDDGHMSLGQVASASSILELWDDDAHPILSITAAHNTDYDPQIQFRTDATDTVKFSLGVDASDDSFRINMGSGVGGATHFIMDTNGGVKWQNSTDSTTAYQWLDADGGTPILNIDSTNERVGIGTDTPCSLIEIWDDSAHPILSITAAHNTDYDPQIQFRTDATDTVKFSLGVDASDDSFRINMGSGVGGATHFIMDTNGGVKWQNSTDSTTAYQWLDANGGTPILNIDSTNERVGIGTDTPSSTVHVAGSFPTIKFHNTSFTKAQTFYTALFDFRDKNSDQVGIFGYFSLATNLFTIANEANGVIFMTGGISYPGNVRMIIDSTGQVGIGELSPETLLEMTSTAPIETLHNSTEENIEGGRECIWRAKGEKQDSTEHTLGQMQFSHDGTGDDYKADFILSVNKSDGAADNLTEAMRIDSNLLATFAGAIKSGTTTVTAAGPTDDLDVSGVNVIFIDTSGNNVTLGGTTGGVDGQVLHVVIHDATNNTTIEHAEGTGNQDFYLHAGADETLTAEYGGWTFINHNGNHWHDVSHAKHV